MGKRRMKKNQKKKSSSGRSLQSESKSENIFGQKFALTIFGLGPIILVFGYLYRRGFFETIN